jgi:ribosomal protein L11 methyltransferase
MAVSGSWFELTVEVPQEWSDAVASFLFDNGTPGLQTEDRKERSALIAYFRNEPPIEPLRRLLAAIGGSAVRGGLDIRVRRIADVDWAHNWKPHFQPLLIGERLYVCPSWAAPAPSGRAAVVIDPGMAFGTGHHGSTRGCLRLLDCATRELRINRALDLGTGSGVLAIALAKLGVPEVWAIDNDPSARAIAAGNIERNRVGACVRTASNLDEVPGPFDLVIANLFANILEELAPRLTQAVRPGGTLICSGFVAGDELRMRDVYRALGMVLDRHCEEETWVTLALRRKA